MPSASSPDERCTSGHRPAFYCVDGTGSVTFVSRYASELTGLDRGAVLWGAGRDAADPRPLALTRTEVAAEISTNQSGGRLVILHARRIDADAEPSVRAAECAAPAPAGDLAPWIAHELRTPLACILGAAELLASSLDGRTSPDEQDLLGSLLRNGERLSQRIDEAIVYVTETGLRCDGSAR